jgi:hypothetical protein
MNRFRFIACTCGSLIAAVVALSFSPARADDTKKITIGMVAKSQSNTVFQAAYAGAKMPPKNSARNTASKSPSTGKPRRMKTPKNRPKRSRHSPAAARKAFPFRAAKRTRSHPRLTMPSPEDRWSSVSIPTLRTASVSPTTAPTTPPAEKLSWTNWPRSWAKPAPSPFSPAIRALRIFRNASQP